MKILAYIKWHMKNIEKPKLYDNHAKYSQISEMKEKCKLIS